MLLNALKLGILTWKSIFWTRPQVANWGTAIFCSFKGCCFCFIQINRVVFSIIHGTWCKIGIFSFN